MSVIISFYFLFAVIRRIKVAYYVTASKGLLAPKCLKLLDKNNGAVIVAGAQHPMQCIVTPSSSRSLHPIATHKKSYRF